MVFHSINISKVILNSFHWFWPLDYVLESFCTLGWDFHHRGRENIIFVNFFVWDLFLLMIFFGCWPIVAKRICIKGRFHDVHALCLFMFVFLFALWCFELYLEYMLCCSHCIVFVCLTCIHPYAIMLHWMHVPMIICFAMWPL